MKPLEQVDAAADSNLICNNPVVSGMSAKCVQCVHIGLFPSQTVRAAVPVKRKSDIPMTFIP
ncbi:hypothetical protein D3C73_1332220 [compost metagenome]